MLLLNTSYLYSTRIMINKVTLWSGVKVIPAKTEQTFMTPSCIQWKMANLQKRTIQAHLKNCNSFLG